MSVTSGQLTYEIEIEASPETIFSFLIDPDKMVRWKGFAAELDPRPGGLYRVQVTKAHTARGEYVEIVSNQRVVFTWGWESEGHPVPPGGSTVEIELEPRGSKTLLRLTHSGLSEEMRAVHSEGWDHYLSRLAIAAAGGDAGRDPWIDRDA